MRPGYPISMIVRGTKQLVTNLIVTVAVMFLPHGALARPNDISVLHFTFTSTMTNTDINPGARGTVDGTLDRVGTTNALRLRISVAKLATTTVYRLVAYLGSNTNSTNVTEFATNPNGEFTITYVKEARTNATPGGIALPEILDPICTVREFAIVNLSNQTVLLSDLTDTDRLQYHVNNSMANTGFIPGAVGTLRFDATKHQSRFSLRAGGLMPVTVYLLTTNGSVVQADTTDRAGRLDLKAPFSDPMGMLDIHLLALTDSSGTNVVLTTNGLGIPCDITPPTISFTSPANAATGVPLNTQLAATFSEPINPLTISSANFTLMQGSTTVTGTVSYVGVTAIFTPAADLAPLTNYTATIATGPIDLAGNALAAPFVWSFTTGTTPDTTPPTVVSIVPTNAATTVPINQAIAATFSKVMDPLTISNDTFTLMRGSTAVTGLVNYAGVTATFAPMANLATLTTYTATITTGVTDLAGNALAADFVWNFTTGSSTDTTPPTVTATNPTNTAQNVALNQTVNATFSEAIDPTTITTTSFTLTGPGATTVAGTVAYVAASAIASFTPSTNLLPNTTYTNTIATSVKDLAGNALATNFVWSFTTGAQIDTNLIAINLGSASTFAILATAAISGSGNHINGDVGLHPGSAQGIPLSEINGTVYVNDQAVMNAQASLLAAYTEAANRSSNVQVLPTDLGGLTLYPGLYQNATSTGISGTGANAVLTLDAQGDPNAVFVMQTASTLITAAGSSIVLSGGAQAKNIFWQVGSSATLNTTTLFSGNILAAVTITVDGGSVVEGSLFAGSAGDGSGAVTVQSSTITAPSP